MSNLRFFYVLFILWKIMAPPPTLCSNSHCRHQGNSIPPEYFRKGDSPPDCYVYLKRCSDCRGTCPIPLASHLLSSPVNARRKKYGKCRQLWSLHWFPYRNQGMCIYCSTSTVVRLPNICRSYNSLITIVFLCSFPSTTRSWFNWTNSFYSSRLTTSVYTITYISHPCSTAEYVFGQVEPSLPP